MDDRDDRAERELFKKVSAKEIRAVTIAFIAIGAVSLAAGLILMAFNVRSEESNVLIGIFFALFGVFVLLCAAIFHLIMSKKYTYEVYKKRTKKRILQHIRYGGGIYYAKGTQSHVRKYKKEA